ncbi:hypothetical protein GNY06_00945 [Elizabethkingia argentiflava]|uniref:Uncharacterized protein n=1 Tax=Elizabethkingia argenteiflava TaxID=2681556 RepID=A0A845PSV9_9FLAO|nr:hypothetical protein [Elizabethkingia argenteiflava]NAW50016.1 hypothetical protein [Elizabethkingia argenteiflava]
MHYFLDKKLLSIIENARKEPELKISNSSVYQPDIELKKYIQNQFLKSSFHSFDHHYKNKIDVTINVVNNTDKNNFNKLLLGVQWFF